LDGDEELMLYVLRNPAGEVDHASGTRVRADATVQYFDESAWAIQVLDRWASPKGGRYPIAWELTVGGRRMRIDAAFPDQENRGTLIPDLAYWEGAVSVSDPETGEPIGRGFVEMTGY
ncbi:MAG: lipocalin family protein, partial [Myxococcota bacterium]